MIFPDIDTAINFISTSAKINYDESFDLAVYCSKLQRINEHHKDARDIVIRVRDRWDVIPENTKIIWNDLTEAAGLYPYVDPENLSKSALLRYEYHKSPFLKNIYLHEEQLELSIALQNKQSVVLSAPTSFGKSLLIEEIIASKIYKNIVIIQPTLALLDETRKKLFKYKENYKVILSTNQEIDTAKGNIFLFTGERVVEYPQFPKIDFFVIDEFYKLSLERDDDRALVLNQAFQRLLKFTNKFYLLGPMVKNIPLSFKDKFKLLWFPTEFSTVAVDESSLEITGKIKATEKKVLKKRMLFEFLSNNSDQTLIYCSSPNKATQLGLEFIQYLTLNKINNSIENLDDNIDMIEWVRQSINPEWSLVDALKKGVAFHHGALPRHLGSSIVDAFNFGSVRYLFCTSTLIEGVNTSAKNVILFDKEKGTKSIDFFDYKNIAGRSGRMKKHFIGRVIRFEKQPEQMELFVDIPLFNQEKAPLELLISLNDEDIDKNVKDRLEVFNNYSDNLKNVLKKNSGIKIEAQLKIIRDIESNLQIYSTTLNWNSFPPSYNHLLAVIDLAWKYLLKPGENKADVRSQAQLTMLTLKYAGLKSTAALIQATINDPFWMERYPEREDRINKISFFILNVTRHWFDYKLPKWLSVISNLQEYVFKKANLSYGNYSFYASNIEHSFLSPNLAALMEYSIPYSAIRKLINNLSEEIPVETIIKNINQISDEQLKKRGLINYEIYKLRNAL